MAISGENLYAVMVSGSPDEKASLLADFKAHVKKDNVTLAYVPKYFESLSIAIDGALHSVAFSVICHLVKRVSIQDASGDILLEQSFLVLPIIIPRIADPKSSVKLTARRALEAYWLSAPKMVEQAIAETGLANRNSLIVNESVVWLNHVLTTINPHFQLGPFFEPLARVLASHEQNRALVDNIKVLFANYYDLKQNRLHKFELQKVLEAHRVSSALQTSIMGIDSILAQENQRPKPLLSKLEPSSVETRRPVERSLDSRKPVEKVAARSEKSQDPRPSTESSPSQQSALDALLASLPNYSMDSSIVPQDVDDHGLSQAIADMQPCFVGKETERNWAAREKSILSLRSFLRGSAGSLLLEDFLHSIREIHEDICKGLTSLRTALCLSSCHLVKELALTYQSSFDSVAELFLPTLIRLCAATKHLTTTNANVAVSAIFVNCTVSTRLIQKAVQASTDKSANTKSYSASWLLIILMRSHDSGTLFSEPADRILLKLLPDPNLQVRLAAKKAFWVYHNYSQESASALVSRLDQSTVKALERSKPATLAKQASVPLTSRKSRPSIKEAIMAKNKEVRKQAASRSSSRNQLRDDTEIDLSSEPPRSTSSTLKKGGSQTVPLPTRSTPEPHYAQSTFAQRSSSFSGSGRHHKETSQSSIDRTVKHSPERLLAHSRTPEHISSFDRRSDPIIQFLSSQQEELIKEGIHLLRYAIISDEELPKEVRVLLRKASISHPALLKPLLTEGDNLFKKCKNHFLNEDFVRVCSILLSPSAKLVDSLSLVYSSDEFYESVGVVLSYIADLENIVDEKLLVMQIIKMKSKVLDMLVNLLSIATSKIPITDVVFAKLVSRLFELVPIVHQTPTSEEYATLLKSLYAINSVLFISQLSLTNRSIKKEVEHLVGIDDVRDYAMNDTVYNGGELTQVAPGKNVTNLSPLKQPLDFTMLMPTKKIIPESPSFLRDGGFGNESLNIAKPVHLEDKNHTDETYEKPEVVESNAMSLADTEGDDDIVMEDTSFNANISSAPAHVSKSPTPERPQHIKIIDREESPLDVFSQSDSNGQKTDFFAKLHSDSSTELVDGFAQVKLTCPANSIETFISKVDPLNKISNKNRIITIFEDSQAGSPQKVKEYSYTDLNWFNFLVARLSLESGGDYEDYSVEDFKFLCGELRNGLATVEQFRSLLRYLQVSQNGEFRLFFEEGGMELLEHALWSYLTARQSLHKLHGMMIVKQLLINRSRIHLQGLWDAIVEVCATESSDPLRELEVAVGEAFDEALCGLYSSSELLTTVVQTLDRSDHLTPEAVRFAVESMRKLMCLTTLSLVIDDDLVAKVDGVLRKLLGHKEAEVRKNVFQAYGRMLQAARTSDYGGGRSGCGRMNDVLLSVSGPQRKMMEYFS